MILDKFVVIVHKFVRFSYTKIKKCTLCAKKCTGVWKETSTFVS